MWGLREDSNFQLVSRPQKLSFWVFSSRRSSLTQIFVESCVDFEVASLSVLMVQRLPYPEIPYLKESYPSVTTTAYTCFTLVRPG